MVYEYVKNLVEQKILYYVSRIIIDQFKKSKLPTRFRILFDKKGQNRVKRIFMIRGS